MKTFYCLYAIITAFGVVAVSFRQKLQQNVERYKHNNFRWNTRNLNDNSILSVRKLEERKDEEFRQYLKHLRRNDEYLLSMVHNNEGSLKQRRHPSRMCYRCSQDHDITNHGPSLPKNIMGYSVTKRSVEKRSYRPQPEEDTLQLLNVMRYDVSENSVLSKEDSLQPMHVLAYNSGKQAQREMVYNENLQSMLYSDTLQPMLYKDTTEVENLGKRSPRTMLYNANVQPLMYNANLQPMMYNNKPQSMMYNANLQSMLYSDTLQPMLYKDTTEVENLGKRSPRAMLYNANVQPLMYNANLQPMMYRNKPQSMMYNANLQSMLYSDKLQPMLYKDTTEVENFGKRSLTEQKTGKLSLTSEQYVPSKELKNSRKSSDWISTLETLVKVVPEKSEDFFRNWSHTISVLGDDHESRQQFKHKFRSYGIDTVIKDMASSSVFEKLFWPFVYDNGFMNQKLGLLGLSSESSKAEKQKLLFYEALEKCQTLKIPISDKIFYSFNDPGLVEGLNRSGLVEMSKRYVESGLHLYTQEEQTEILNKVEAAMNMINNSMPNLYRVIHQVVGSIAYYKAQHGGFAGGSISSALGVIWQDPRAYREQSVAHYAEQIVHEFIHTSLFLADFVHGTFTDFNLLTRAKVYSPIRHELRDFDKAFHASYVSAGVALFHARAGNWEKAYKQLEPLRTSVDGLVKINKELGVLNDSGNAMLQALDDFLTIIRLA